MTYLLAVAGAVPIAFSSPVAPNVTAEAALNERGMEIDALMGVTGSTGSSGPPLPTCGTFIEEIRYGPISVFEFVSDPCRVKNPDKPYVEQHVQKIKRVHQNGSIWECPRYAITLPRCGEYVTTSCPDNTCIK